jgi:hypothetical protein
MGRFVVLVVILFTFMSGCSIPKEGIRPDGVVVIDLVAQKTFRVAGHLFFESDLEVALERTDYPEVQNFELRIPYSMLKANDGRNGCGNLAQVMIAAHRPWKAFAWVPNDETTLKEIFCDTVVVA